MLTTAARLLFAADAADAASVRVFANIIYKSPNTVWHAARWARRRRDSRTIRTTSRRAVRNVHALS